MCLFTFFTEPYFLMGHIMRLIRILCSMWLPRSKLIQVRRPSPQVIVHLMTLFPYCKRIPLCQLQVVCLRPADHQPSTPTSSKLKTHSSFNINPEFFSPLPPCMFSTSSISSTRLPKPSNIFRNLNSLQFIIVQTYTLSFWCHYLFLLVLGSFLTLVVLNLIGLLLRDRLI